MNLTLAKQILQAAQAKPDGCLELHSREMRREAELMQEEGWLEIKKAKGARASIVARGTETGRRISRLFTDDAVAQRLRAAFMSPRSAG